MKLEELLPLSVKVASHDEEDEEKVVSKTSNALEEGADNAEDAVDENTEKESAGVKKKGTRKKRSLNWEEAERGLLLEVIKPKVEFVENRSVDAKSIKAKRLAWTQITKQFNALNFRHRLLEQIQVQWRSMKNSAKREHQQKHPKEDALDGMRMIEFMEEMQKEPISARSQTRNSGSAVTIKKEMMDIDEDEDMPLAALPNSTNGSDDTLQTSTIAIPSPPPSTAGGDSQQESCQQPTPTRNRKRTKETGNKNPKEDNNSLASDTNNSPGSSRKRQRPRNVSQNHATSDDPIADMSSVPSMDINTNAIGASGGNSQYSNASSDVEYKFKHELFKLIKQARLAEMDYARREHEQRLRFGQMEQELKIKYFRQEHDLKLLHMREEYDMRRRHQLAEHEARLNAYIGTNIRQRSNVKHELNDTAITGAPTSAALEQNTETPTNLTYN